MSMITIGETLIVLPFHLPIFFMYVEAIGSNPVYLAITVTDLVFHYLIFVDN